MLGILEVPDPQYWKRGLQTVRGILEVPVLLFFSKKEQRGDRSSIQFEKKVVKKRIHSIVPDLLDEDPE